MLLTFLQSNCKEGSEGGAAGEAIEEGLEGSASGCEGGGTSIVVSVWFSTFATSPSLALNMNTRLPGAVQQPLFFLKKNY